MNKPAIKSSSRILNLKRVADGGMVTVKDAVNGLMRATESENSLVAVDGYVPVTVQSV